MNNASEDEITIEQKLRCCDELTPSERGKAADLIERLRRKCEMITLHAIWYGDEEDGGYKISMDGCPAGCSISSLIEKLHVIRERLDAGELLDGAPEGHITIIYEYEPPGPEPHERAHIFIDVVDVDPCHADRSLYGGPYYHEPLTTLDHMEMGLQALEELRAEKRDREQRSKEYDKEGGVV